MRKLMAEIGIEGNAFDDGTKPVGDSLVVDIPEAASTNSGKGTCIPSGDFIRSTQTYQILVKNSGNAGNYPVDHAADFVPNSSFLFRLNPLKDSSGNYIADESNYMGEDRPYTPIYHTALRAAFATYPVLFDPKVIELKNGKTRLETYSYVGFCSVLEIDTGNASAIRFFRLRDAYSSSTGVESYGWENVVPTGLPATFEGSNITQACCELDDGSLLLNVQYSYGWDTYRSLDQGSSWEKVSEGLHGWGGGAAQWYTALTTLGNRVIFSATVRSTTDLYVYIWTSDDQGSTWVAKVIAGHDDTENVAGYEYHQGVVGKNGCAYVIHHGAATILAAYYSYDGETWLTADFEDCSGEEAFFNFVQDNMGNWYKWTFADATIQVSVIDDKTDQDLETNSLFSDFWNAQQNSDSVNDYTKGVLCAFNDGAFFDVIYVNYYATTPDYTLNALRFKMWCSATIGTDMSANAEVFDSCWTADAYPSSSDSEPSQDIFAKTSDVGTATLTVPVNYCRSYLKLTKTGVGKYILYDITFAGTPDDIYDTGMVARFSLKLKDQTNNYAIVLMRGCSQPSNKDAHFKLIFAKVGAVHKIVLWDMVAGAATQTFTCTYWDHTTNPSEYLLIYKENKVTLYRATRRYGEICQYEKIFNDVTITTGNYAADNDYVSFGIADSSTYTYDSEAYFYYFYTKFSEEYNDNAGASFALNATGRRCSPCLIGLAQGVSAYFRGTYLKASDFWEMKTKAIYDAENIFIWTPSIYFKEPDTVTPADQVFLFQCPDVYSETTGKFYFNGLALFGRNFNRFKLEGYNTAALTWDTLLDKDGRSGSHQFWKHITAVGSDVNSVSYTISGSQQPFFPHALASKDRRFYLAVPFDANHDYIFEIIDNDGSYLILDSDVDFLGLASTDCYIFTDRIFCPITALTNSPYEKVRFTIYAPQSYPPNDGGARLGCLVLGLVATVDDDVWESTIRYEPNVLKVSSRTGTERYRNQGKMKRTLNLKYTGIIDQGMGKEEVLRTLEFSRWGERPLVWLDDSSPLDANLYHHDPILVRVASGISHSRQCYFAENDILAKPASGSPYATTQVIENIVDVDGVELEEII
jgi:hypothetical protein